MVNAGTAQVCRVFNNATGGNNGRIPPVRVSETGVLLDSIITNNTQGVWGKGAGGLYIAGGEVRRCLIAFNKGPEMRSPNGVWVAGGTLADSVIYKNEPRSGGSGTYGVQVSGGTVERCVIAFNKAVTAGGIGITDSATVRNCLVVGNSSTTTAAASSGGIYLGASGAKVHHVTVVGNTGNGGSDGVNAASGELKASIMNGNGLVDCVSGGATVSGCCFPNGTGANIDVDPMFDPNSFTYRPSVADYDSYRIGRFSLCRNAGPATPLVTDDLLGNARPQAGGELPDLGCYELQPAGPGEFYLGVTTEYTTVPSGESIVFNAVSEGNGVTVARYEWRVTTNGVSTTVSTTEPTLTVENAPGGACAILLTAYDAGGAKAGTAENTVSVKPRDVYVAVDGGNVYPYATSATAARTIADALTAVYCESSRPGRVHVAAGDYPSATTIAAVTVPVEIIGQGCDFSL